MHTLLAYFHINTNWSLNIVFREDDSRVVLDVIPEPFAWCKIPAGRVTLEENPDWCDIKLEDIGDTFEVQPFCLAKYPITVEQYQVFAEDPKGFLHDEWWEGLAERRDWVPVTASHAPNLPASGTTWYEAMAFCRWLGSRVGHDVRLPTEYEWQWAAQGPDQLLYPNGNTFLSGKCTLAESRRGPSLMPKPVDSHPLGASPFGMQDLVGNVWEWCLNESDNPHHLDPGGSERRGRRGGAFNTGANHVNNFTRKGYFPEYTCRATGFRIAFS